MGRTDRQSQVGVLGVFGPRGIAIGLLLLVFLLLPLFVRSPYHLHLVILFLLWVGLGQSWNLLGGFTGQVSFGHAAFFGTGAYVTSLLYVGPGIPLLVGGLLGGLFAAVLSIPIGLICFRLRGPYFALTILGISEILRIIAINWRSLTKGPVGVLFPPIFRDRLPFYYIVLALAVLTMVVVWLTLRSKAGYYFRALRDDQDAATALGIDPTRFKLVSLILSAFLTGLLGGFFAPYQGYIDPDVVFSIPDISIAMIVVVVLGGMGNLWGPPVGAIIVVVLSEIFRATLGEAHLLVYAALMIVIVVFLPEGLVGWFARLYSRWSSHPRPAVSTLPDRPAATVSPESGPAGRALLAVGGYGGPDGVLLRAEKVTKAFGGLLALQSVDFQVRQGEVLGLIGPNGAGKTTLLSVISGFEQATAGKITFGSHDITRLPAYRAAHLGVARTFQIVRPLKKMSVLDNVVTAALANTVRVGAARQKAEEILQFVDLYHRRQVLAAGLTLGERKRLEMARALATSPKLLLLDEVAAGLNSTETKAVVAILERIREAGISIVAVEHVMQVIMSISDRIVVLDYGQVLAEGKPAEVARNPEVIQAYLGASEANGSA
ncbi:MAG TPA: branched-chain amino acid ABC transporter ATP-binding protein/permease [Candidatus Methylomirabilis sp.]|nr:branched-chain amino acid ABC transporter ATP-binding protein/permease [Candidatus Methylomirabilis sp.]